MKKSFILLLIIALLAVALTACDGMDDKDTYTLVYANTNYGAVTYKAGDQIALPADPIKEGFTFEGWFADADFNTEFEFGVMPKKDLTVYAKWEEIPTFSFTYQPLTEYFSEINIDSLGLTADYLSEDGVFFDGYAITAVELNDNTDIVIPAAYNDKPVYVLGGGVFMDTDITSVHIPASIVFIDSLTFKNCESLQSVNYADGSNLFSFGTEVFYNCSALTELVLPAKLTLMGTNVLKNCRNLQTVYVEHQIDYRNSSVLSDYVTPNPDYRAHDPSWMGTHGATGMFDACMSLETIYAYLKNGDAPVYEDPLRPGVLTGVMVYQSHPYWSDYASLIVPHPSGI